MAELMNPDEFLRQTEGLVPQAPSVPKPEQALVSPDDFLKQTEFVEYQGLGSQLAAAGAGLARGLTFGVSDVVGRALGINERLAKLKEYQPGLSLTGELTGAIAPTLLTGGVGGVATAARFASAPVRAVAKAGQIVEGAIARRFVSEAAKSSARKVLEGAAAKGLGSALEGLAYGAGQVVSEAALGDPKQVAENAMATLGVSALLGGSLGAGIRIVAPVAKGTVESVNKFLKDWPQRLIGLDDETIKTINAKPEKIQELIALSDVPDTAVLTRAKELGAQLQSARDQALQRITAEADSAVAPIRGARIQAGSVIDSLEQAKTKISPDDIRLDPQVAASLKQLDDVIDTSYDVAARNAGYPQGEEKTRLIREAADTVFEQFENQREAFLVPRWQKLAQEVERLKVDPQALPLKPYLDAIDDQIAKLGLDEVTIGEGGKQTARQLFQLKKDLENLAKQNLGVVKPRGLSKKELQKAIEEQKLPGYAMFLKGNQLVSLKRAFKNEADFVSELGKTTPVETLYRNLYGIAKKQLDDLSPDVIKPINEELQKGIQAAEVLKAFGLKKRGGDVELRKDAFAKLFAAPERLSPATKKAIEELDKLYGTQIAKSQKAISEQFDIRMIPKERLQLDAGQLEQIRNQLATKLAGMSPDSRAYQGIVEAHNRVVSALKQAGAPNIEKVANEQIELLRALNQMSRYGLDSEVIDPAKLKDFLLTTIRRSEKDFENTAYLSKALGIDLIEAREFARAFYNMTQQVPLQRLSTGASAVIPGGLALLGSFAGPGAAAAGFLAGAAAQTPKNLPAIINALSASQKGMEKIADKLVQFGGSAAQYIPPNTIPFVSGKLAALTTLERQNQKVDRQINSAINGFINEDPLEPMPTSPSTLKETSFTRPYTRSLDDRIDAFNKRLGEIVQVSSNLESLQTRIANNTKAVNYVAPQVAQNLMAKGIEATQFLLNKAPKNPIADELQPQRTDWQPSDAELARFERYVEAVENPLQIFRDLKSGIITTEQVETLRTLYPGIYQKLVMGLREKLANSKTPLSYEKKNQLSMLFQQPLTQLHKPRVLAMLQQPMAEQPQSQPRFSAQSRKLVLNNLTETQRIESGA